MSQTTEPGNRKRHDKKIGGNFATSVECRIFAADSDHYTQLLPTIHVKIITKKAIATMKKGIHPENYRPVVFKDMSNGDMFLSRSTCKTTETVEFEGETYPVVKLEISSSSHPFYTGKSKLVDTAGRVDKFMSRYGQSRKK